MPNVLLLQLPAPHLNFGRKTANIAFAAANLKQAADFCTSADVEILEEDAASCLGDRALLNLILQKRPDSIGFTIYMWNVARSLYMVRQIKSHYAPRILFGGPEITPDNELVRDANIDGLCFGSGEKWFVEMMSSSESGQRPARLPSRLTDAFDFEKSPSPYLTGALGPPGGHHPMLLETMRGCPHGCAYCYYHKSFGKPAFKHARAVLDGIVWAIENNVKEIYVLDPSLDARPDLNPLLKEIASINKNHRVRLVSEIRAEPIDSELADLLAAAGFSSFEIGLQTTNPVALSLIHRRTDLARWVDGVHQLHRRGIKTAIDLILGLPGDDPVHFRRSIEFVCAHRLQESIQVFPLLLLPGTRLRQTAGTLGISYSPSPPYTILSSPGFSADQLASALDDAETRLDVALFPQPDLELSYADLETTIDQAPDLWVEINAHRFVRKVVLHPERPFADLFQAAQIVTSPYQLLIPPGMTHARGITRCVTLFTENNPFTPLELVFFEPRHLPCLEELLRAAKIERPHYLDGDLRWLHPQPGNRAVLFTCVTRGDFRGFDGPMQRAVFWWTCPRLPDRSDLDRLEKKGFCGILINPPLSAALETTEWQKRTASFYDDTIAISFARTGEQRRWFARTAPEAYHPDLCGGARPSGG
jgi:hypothetical protein